MGIGARSAVAEHELFLGGRLAVPVSEDERKGAAPKRAVVQVWDSMEELQARLNDPQYKEARKIGGKYAKFRTYAVDGVAQ